MKMFNPWHDFDSSRIKKDRFWAFIEIPKGSKNKYELDKETGLVKLDRVLSTSVQYPANYGFVPKTYANDEDPLDVLVLCQETIPQSVLVEVVPIGVMLMEDGGELDEKIISIAVKDMVYSSYKNIEDLPHHLTLEMEHFFNIYKAFEDKKVEIKGFRGKEEAIKIIEKSIIDYKEKFGE
ncbi:MAG: inorganic diphosphatase [Clostridia bacterium]|nr:inorganic diphosphatase [Clostridia bacterium]MDD4376159.1 inorganic diphosphatase [Clostridia bacterium]